MKLGLVCIVGRKFTHWNIFFEKLIPENMTSEKVVLACLVNYGKVTHSRMPYLWLNIYFQGKVV